MSINNSLLNDVEKLFIKFFEMYNQCVRGLHILQSIR